MDDVDLPELFYPGDFVFVDTQQEHQVTKCIRNKVSQVLVVTLKYNYPFYNLLSINGSSVSHRFTIINTNKTVLRLLVNLFLSVLSVDTNLSEEEIS